MAGLVAALLAVAGVAVVFAQSDLGSNTNYNSSGWAIQYPAFHANEIAVTVTNGQEVAVFGGNSYVLTGIGQANGYTNTITLALPYRVAGQVDIRVASGSTNLVGLADSTTVVALGANVVLGPTDTLRLKVVATNEIVKLSTSDN